jgi:hypothetical protein
MDYSPSGSSLLISQANPLGALKTLILFRRQKALEGLFSRLIQEEVP